MAKNSDELKREVHTPRFEKWLIILREQGGSDLYLVAGLPPSIRVHGSIRQLQEPVLDGDEIEENVLPSLPQHTADSYRTKGYGDASFRRGSEGRFRINLHRERGRAAASIRAADMWIGEETAANREPVSFFSRTQ